jgi:hypothetical protein
MAAFNANVIRSSATKTTLLLVVHACSFAPPPIPAVPVASTFSVTTLLDFELLHNFSIKAPRSQTDKVDIQGFFSINFVPLAFGYDYLLHSILALSAFPHSP